MRSTSLRGTASLWTVYTETQSVRQTVPRVVSTSGWHFQCQPVTWMILFQSAEGEMQRLQCCRGERDRLHLLPRPVPFTCTAALSGSERVFAEAGAPCASLREAYDQTSRVGAVLVSRWGNWDTELWQVFLIFQSRKTGFLELLLLHFSE